MNCSTSVPSFLLPVLKSCHPVTASRIVSKHLNLVALSASFLLLLFFYHTRLEREKTLRLFFSSPSPPPLHHRLRSSPPHPVTLLPLSSPPLESSGLVAVRGLSLGSLSTSLSQFQRLSSVQVSQSSRVRQRFCFDVHLPPFSLGS